MLRVLVFNAETSQRQDIGTIVKDCLLIQLVGANGKERNTTLRDARQHGYVPSVTTIIGMAAKPSLENWKINQALNSAITLDTRSR